jgi:nitroimidazol reductase NimA-like FMN-containing flavoprotein (pyridoxamine 5'-phosphate oxidase superfamily)
VVRGELTVFTLTEGWLCGTFDPGSGQSACGTTESTKEVSMAMTVTFEVLTEAECRRLLAEQEVGRIAFTDADGFPVVLPVNFVVDGDAIAIRSDLGAKTDRVPLRQVAFEVDGIERWNQSGWSVLVQGHGQDVTDAVGRRYEDLRRRGLTTWAPGDKGHWLTIDIRRISGRRIVAMPERHGG